MKGTAEINSYHETKQFPLSRKLFFCAKTVTRKQIAVMLFNYTKYAGLAVSDINGNETMKFTDTGRISKWAESSVKWTFDAGIISGNIDGSFAPAANATRAQAAKMVTVLLKSLN